MADDQELLMSQNSQPQLPQIIWRKHFTFLLITTLTFIGTGMEFYTSTQWIQYYVKHEMFSYTVNNTGFYGCEAKNHSDPDYIAYEKVQAQTAEWQLYKNVAGSIPATLLTLVLPSYSDSFGRRFLFIFGLIGQLLMLLIETTVMYFKLNLYFFISGSAIAGLFGSFYSISSASYSYIADITRGSNKRAVGISIYDGTMITCTMVSGFACGYMITYKRYLFPMVTGSIMLLVALILTVLFLPETHEKSNRAETVNVYRMLSRSFDFYKSSTFKGRRMGYSILISTFFLQELTTIHRSSIEMIYQLGMPLCWTARNIGLFTAIRHAAQAAAGIVFIIPLKACLSDLNIAIWSTLFNAGSYVMEGLVRKDLAMYLVSVPATFSFLAGPMIKSIMSSISPADRQGSLFASISAVQSMCNIVANFLLNYIYSATVTFMDGFVFLVLAGLGVLVAALLVVYGFTQRTDNTSSASSQ